MPPNTFYVSTSSKIGFLPPSMYLLSEKVAKSYSIDVISESDITKDEISQFQIDTEGGCGVVM